ncbi:MAG TPA: NAD(P)/FAD-dependent oxidoreductase [Pyrinomonadaceae bacterium]|jgi:flavin-dependent dehydrogenase|nr:NAD(P)/FAD-dependent oxidoreductase [Pyrinomonadaceae bacterium]
MSDFDAIIIGGGPAGAGAAIHLAAAGARVLVAEQKKFPRAKLCGEFISPECLEHFARLGVSERMTRAGGSQVSETVFYAPSGRGLSVPSEWFGGGAQGALGLSRAEMDNNLLARAREVGASVIEEATLAGVVVEGGRVCGVRLHVEGGESEFTSRVLIDATGRQRVLSRRAERELRQGGDEGARVEGNEGRREADRREASGRVGGGKEFEPHAVEVTRGVEAPKARERLVAFKAHLEGATGAARACEIYFYPGGYGGLSPVEGGVSNLCFIARARDVRERGSDAERVMREVLMRNRRAARTLETARAATRWLGVSIESFGRHEPAPRDGLLAVGDAAAFIDPFTGSGMLMALESGELAARSILRWLSHSLNPHAQSDSLARDYRAAYARRFDSRLRLCGMLRRAAFAPAQFAEAAVVALGASTRLRRRLARATRRSAVADSPR